MPDDRVAQVAGVNAGGIEQVTWHRHRRRRCAGHEEEGPSFPSRCGGGPLSRRDIPLREKTLWRMLYGTAARAAEILALNVEVLDLEHRRAPVRSKGGATYGMPFTVIPSTRIFCRP
ncbi:hypothetical protein ACIA8R_44810 [Nonomuraea sp. NPDC051191]|uniref:hypothetical protein n=1 Tax=Nonomuraea sp. NPDC051191 TaxID=3364372 RepID=UPI00379452B3